MPLCILIKSIWKTFCMVGQHQDDHFDVVLQSMQKYHGALVWKFITMDAKSGHQDNNSWNDHLQFGLLFLFFFLLLFGWGWLIRSMCGIGWDRRIYFGKFVFLEDLNSVKTFRLCMLKISIWKTFYKFASVKMFTFMWSLKLCKITRGFSFENNC